MALDMGTRLYGQPRAVGNLNATCQVVGVAVRPCGVAGDPSRHRDVAARATVGEATISMAATRHTTTSRVSLPLIVRRDHMSLILSEPLSIAARVRSPLLRGVCRVVGLGYFIC